MYIIRYGDQNNKVLLKIFKLFRIIPKKKIFTNFFQNLGGGGEAPSSPCDGPPLYGSFINGSCNELQNISSNWFKRKLFPSPPISVVQKTCSNCITTHKPTKTNCQMRRPKQRCKNHICRCGAVCGYVFKKKNQKIKKLYRTAPNNI